MIQINYHTGIFILIGIICIYLQFIQNEDSVHTTTPHLSIAILSARQNFNKREAIRRSWGWITKELKNMHLNFFVGKECSIPLVDRVDRIGCSEAENINFDLHSSATKKYWGDLVCNFTPDDWRGPSLSKSGPCLFGFGFHIVHPLQITSVGVHLQLLNGSNNLKVIFKDPETVWETIFLNKAACTHIEKNFCFVNLKDAYYLPKYFEGEISLSIEKGFEIFPEHCFWITDDCLRFMYGKTSRGYEKYQNKSCFYVIANFSLPDKAALEQHLAERTERRSKWLNGQQRIESQLESEAQKYGDIIYLPNLIDVYKNLPHKLLEVFKWAHKNDATTPVFKIDDDTYVNVTLLSRLIHGLSVDEEEPAIWAHFHYDRAVPLFGKGSDPEFRSITYPPFPSGSGYIVSGSLVSLLAEKASILKRFQGEDISIGIWTEALQLNHKDIQKYDVRCWMPSSECKESLLIPELTVEQMIGYA